MLLRTISIVYLFWFQVGGSRAKEVLWQQVLFDIIIKKCLQKENSFWFLKKNGLRSYSLSDAVPVCSTYNFIKPNKTK